MRVSIERVDICVKISFDETEGSAGCGRVYVTNGFAPNGPLTTCPMPTTDLCIFFKRITLFVLLDFEALWASILTGYDTRLA